VITITKLYLHPKGYHQACKSTIRSFNKYSAEKPIKYRFFFVTLVQLPEYNSIPQHDIVVLWSTTNSCRWVLLQPLEIPHQSLPRWSRHPSLTLSNPSNQPLQYFKNQLSQSLDMQLSQTI